MSMLTPDKITEIFYVADELCKEFAKEFKKHSHSPRVKR
jgi:predicted RNA-binding protein